MALTTLIGKGAKLLSSLGGNVAKGGMGSVGGAVLGLGQNIAGRIAEKKADDLLPPSESVMDRQMLNTIRRRRKGLETGTAFNAQQNAANRVASQYMQNSFRSGEKGWFYASTLLRRISKVYATLSSVSELRR